MSSHGQMEQGKDVIAQDSNGNFHAYQLKSATKLTLKAWRAIEGEVVELVELPIQHPAVPAGAPFTPYLVTNGILSDPVRRLVVDRNEAWTARDHPKLLVIARGDLLREFQDTQAPFLPAEPRDFERFLQLYLDRKDSMLDKAAFSAFLESVLPEGPLKRADLRRLFAATGVLANYVLSGYRLAENHLAEAEGWTLTVAHLLRIAERFRTYKPIWSRAVEIYTLAVFSASKRLVQEANQRPSSWSVGDVFFDYAVYSVRRTMVLGWMAAHALALRLEGTDADTEDVIFRAVDSDIEKNGALLVWGESAAPYVLAVSLFLGIRGREARAVDLASFFVSSVCKSNGHANFGESIGLPDPYYSPEPLLRHVQLGESAFDVDQSFLGRSYTIRTFVEFIVRRNWKQRIRRMWYEISDIDYSEFVPDTPTDLYRWDIRKGTDTTRRWSRPESWLELREKADAPSSNELILARELPSMILPFLLTYPHRLTPDLFKAVEEALA